MLPGDVTGWPAALRQSVCADVRARALHQKKGGTGELAYPLAWRQLHEEVDLRRKTKSKEE